MTHSGILQRSLGKENILLIKRKYWFSSFLAWNTEVQDSLHSSLLTDFSPPVQTGPRDHYSLLHCGHYSGSGSLISPFHAPAPCCTLALTVSLELIDGQHIWTHLSALSSKLANMDSSTPCTILDLVGLRFGLYQP